MIRSALLVLIFGNRLLAGELFSWHSFDVAERITKKVDVQVTTRLRTRDAFHLFNQMLGGPMVTYRVNPRLLYFGGYWAQPGHESARPWTMGHRPFCGVDRRWAVSYLYDVRRATWGGNRHAIITSVSFRRPEKD